MVRGIASSQGAGRPAEREEGMSELLHRSGEQPAGVPPPAPNPTPAAGVCAPWPDAPPAPPGAPGGPSPEPAASSPPPGGVQPDEAASVGDDRFPGPAGDDTLIDIAWEEEEAAAPAPPLPARPAGRPKGRRLVPPEATKHPPLTPQQRLLLLDTWQRSGLPAGDFAALVGLSKHTLYAWKKKFDTHGPAGLMDQPKGGPKGSRLSDLTQRTILMLKEANPTWGCQRISDALLRGPALPASASAVAGVLHAAGYELEDVPTRPHPDHIRRFERARPNQLWQTDLFTFILKRQNRRVYLVAFLDDHSRF